MSLSDKIWQCTLGTKNQDSQIDEIQGEWIKSGCQGYYLTMYQITKRHMAPGQWN